MLLEGVLGTHQRLVSRITVLSVKTSLQAAQETPYLPQVETEPGQLLHIKVQLGPEKVSQMKILPLSQIHKEGKEKGGGVEFPETITKRMF